MYSKYSKLFKFKTFDMFQKMEHATIITIIIYKDIF